MSVEASALLRAIRDNPDDDLARLAYADLLEEAGDPDRAALIRTQIDLSRFAHDDPRRRELEDREHAILAANEADWLDDLLGHSGGSTADPDLREWEWERGFLVEVAATPLFMLDHGPDLFAAHPVRRWRVMSSQGDLEADLITSGRTNWISRLEGIDLAGWYQTVGELERFLTRSDFERLCELDLTDRPGLDDLPDVLARSPFRSALKALRCGSTGYAGGCGRLDLWALVRAIESARLTELTAPGALLAAADLPMLFADACGRGLTHLDVRDNEIEPDGWNAFHAAPCRLRDLDLSGTPLGAIALDPLLGCDSLSELRTLDLNRCGSAVANVRALARSRFWHRAETLRMYDGTIPAHTLEPLFASRQGPTSLRTLDLSSNYLYDGGVAELCAAPWSQSLTWLGLSRNYLTDDAARIVARSGRFQHLHTLHLSDNHPAWLDGNDFLGTITDRGVTSLADSAALANVRVLVLHGIPLTPAGVDAAINGPHWRLSGLGLARCNLTAEAVHALAASPRLARLTLLDLSDNPGLHGSALKPLAESEYLCPLTELDVGGLFLDSDVEAALRSRLGRRLSE